MIYIRRDANLIPAKVLRVAERAQQQLEKLPATERPAFIRKKSHIWRAFARHLSRMSYGKCWYSESLEPQSFFDVDHFRPKLEARRSEELTEIGYQWLAFSWENFRYAAGRSNRISKDEDTGDLRGKGNWFPLLDRSPKACWTDRCESSELPVLLDPVVEADVRLLDVESTGALIPSVFCIGATRRHRVERSIELYGLNLPRLVEARKRQMRLVVDLYETLLQTLHAGSLSDIVADELPIEKQAEMIKQTTLPNSPYSKAARAQLIRLGLGELCAGPEELPNLAA
ncbi:MAG TPA: hypothetical protein VF584_03825 [Longimicrobium sp.]|jgi:hypothetical protein